jgi:(p)ppGpp synthase/HD superfamily hydrolase
MSTIEKAIEIATQAHKGQKDKSGAPYILHLIRVMEKGKNETERICGILHDLVEDTSWTFEKLENEGFSLEIIEVLKLVTKESEDEEYSHFMQRVIKNKTAISVKLNDLRDNMDITRLKELTNNDLERLNKYLKAYRLLLEQH